MEQNVLITKMIGIVVAVIVAAVVLVPICNSLTEGDGDSGGNGNGTPTAESWTPYTLQDVYPDLPFSTYKVYGEDVGGTPFSVTSEDIQSMLSSLRDENPASNIPYQALVMIDATEARSLVGNLQYVEAYEGGDGYTMVVTYSSPDGYDEYVIMEDSESPNYNANTSIDITVTSNGYTVDMHNDYGTDVHVTGTTVTFMAWISEDDGGYMPAVIGRDNGGNNIMTPAHVGMDTYTVISGYNNRSDASYGSILCSHIITSEDLASDTMIMSGDISGSDFDTYTIEFVVEEDGDNHYINSRPNWDMTPAYVEPSSFGDEWTVTSGPWLSPTPSSGGGGSGGGDSFDTGVTGTLIKTIPIFVILGIILGSVALFYQNRNGL